MCKLFVLANFYLLVTNIHGQGWEDDLSTLGDRISAQVNRDMAKLQQNLAGLGNRISEQVHANLEPVRALELNNKMKNGIGGVTIVTEKPGDRTFIVKNNQKYTCSGNINLSNGQCDGTLNAFKTTSSSKSDWCFVPNYSLINDQVCLSTGGVNVNYFNGWKIDCSPVNGEAILLSLDEYKKLCQDVHRSTEYTYIPDVNNPNHVAIPNQNNFIKCNNNEKNLCIFNVDNQILHLVGGKGVNVGSNVHVSV